MYGSPSPEAACFKMRGVRGRCSILLLYVLYFTPSMGGGLGLTAGGGGPWGLPGSLRDLLRPDLAGAQSGAGPMRPPGSMRGGRRRAAAGDQDLPCGSVR
jgi:hypothetical protein